MNSLQDKLKEIENEFLNNSDPNTIVKSALITLAQDYFKQGYDFANEWKDAKESPTENGNYLVEITMKPSCVGIGDTNFVKFDVAFYDTDVQDWAIYSELEVLRWRNEVLK